MFVRFNGVRPINLATQSLNASSEANQSSATADNRRAVAGDDFGRALTAHIFSVDGSPSTAKAESIRHLPSLTEPMQPGSDSSSNIATDLRNDDLPLTQPEPVQSAASRSVMRHSGLPGKQDRQRCRGDTPRSTEDQKRPASRRWAQSCLCSFFCFHAGSGHRACDDDISDSES